MEKSERDVSLFLWWIHYPPFKACWSWSRINFNWIGFELLEVIGMFEEVNKCVSREILWRGFVTLLTSIFFWDFQVLFDLFRHDYRLWKAYSTTLEVYLFLFSWCRLLWWHHVYLNEQNLMFLSVFYALQSHPAFIEYQDLLADLEEKLSSVANVEGK